jgi:hypothetical protein
MIRSDRFLTVADARCRTRKISVRGGITEKCRTCFGEQLRRLLDFAVFDLALERRDDRSQQQSGHDYTD